MVRVHLVLAADPHPGSGCGAQTRQCHLTLHVQLLRWVFLMRSLSR